MAENPATTRLRQYLRIRTDHPKPDYKAAASFLKKEAQRIGLPAKVYGKPNKPTVVISLPGKNKTLPSIMLGSHVDVVPACDSKWSFKPFAGFKSDDGKIYGRGAQDMKSQGISYIEAIDRLKCEGFAPNRTIHVVYSPDEEIGGKEGLVDFLNSPQFKAMNVGFAINSSCSSTSSNVYLVFNDERVNWSMDIICQGSSGHGSIMLPNTPGEKVRVVMDEFQDRRQKEGAKLTGKPVEIELGTVTTINLTMIEGGVQENVVPDSFKLTYDISVSVHEDQVQFEKWIDDVLKKAGGGCSVRFIRKEGKVQATKVDDSNPFWLALKAAVEKLGHDVMAVPNPGMSDARHLRRIGVPVLGFTAIRNTPILAHAHDEYIPEKIFLEGIEVYKKVIAAISSVP